jgi:hypothetical protein
MGDFPGGRIHPPVISTFATEMLGGNLAAGGLGTPASAAWPGANLAIFYPFCLAGFYLVRKLWWANGATATGNVDAGIYTIGGARLTSTGSTAQAGTSVVQSVTLGTPLLLASGSYYMALAASSASATFLRHSIGARALNRFGMAEQTASAFPLPDPITPITMTDTTVALCGIARATVI